MGGESTNFITTVCGNEQLLFNYLRGIAQAVGFAGVNKRMDLPPPRGWDGEWDLVSNHSGSHGQGNLLNPERGQQGGGQPARPQPTWKATPRGGLGGIPGAINNDDALQIQSNLSIGAGDFNQGPVRGGQGQQPVRMAPGGGITARIQAAASCLDDATIERELNWQGRVEGEAEKCNSFRDQALNQQGFRAFAFMKGELPVVHMAHSVGTFFGMSGLATDIQGKQIGFVRDQGNGCHPIPSILPLQNSWAWQKTRYLQDTASFVVFYADKNNKDKLWLTGADDNELTEALPSQHLSQNSCENKRGHAFPTNYASSSWSTSMGGNPNYSQ